MVCYILIYDDKKELMYITNLLGIAGNIKLGGLQEIHLGFLRWLTETSRSILYMYTLAFLTPVYNLRVQAVYDFRFRSCHKTRSFLKKMCAFLHSHFTKTLHSVHASELLV